MNEKIIKLCNSALFSCQGFLTKEEFYDVYEYINEYDEWGIGIEVLIDYLSERESKIDQVQYDAIYLALDKMGLSSGDRAEVLKQLLLK